MALAPADFYKLGSGSNSDERKPRRAPAPGTNPAAPPAPAAPGGDPGLYPSDPGLLGRSPEMPDPLLGDLGLPRRTSPLGDALQAAAPFCRVWAIRWAAGYPGVD